MPCMAVPFYDCFYEMFHYLCGICKVEIQLGSAVFSNIFSARCVSLFVLMKC